MIFVFIFFSSDSTRVTRRSSIMDTSMANVMDDLLNVTTLATVDTNTRDTFMEKVKTLTTFKIASLMNTYWFPILTPIGLIGNTLSFFGDDKGEQQENVHLYLHGCYKYK